LDPILASLAVLCLLGTIYFTIAESALLNFSRARVDDMNLSERRRKLIDLHIERRIDLVLAATVLNAVSNVLLVMLIYRIWSVSVGGGLTLLDLVEVLGLSLLGVVLLGELLPWAFVERRPEPYLGRFIVPVAAAAHILKPLLAGIAFINQLISRVAGHPAQDEVDIEDEILSVVAFGEKDGELDEEQTELFENIIQFRDADVAEVMTPRTEMVSVEIGMALRDAVDVGLSTGHSRIPVYDDNQDNITGILYLRDVLSHWVKDERADVALADVTREPVFVPETKQIADMLREMRTRKSQIAIVVDEYGGTSGLITTEDIVEEIVGEIQDEFDRDLTEEILWISEDCIEADARAHVDDINEALHISLPEDNSYDTIGGFVFAQLGRVPKQGETLNFNGVEISVLQADERRIHRLKIAGHREQNHDAEG